MFNFEEQCQTSEKIQEHVPKWKKLLSLKNSSSAVFIEEKIKLKNKESHTEYSFKTIEKKRKKVKEDEVTKEKRKKRKKDKHKKKNQKIDYEKTYDEKDNVKAGINYLIIWRYHKETWKFKKTRQTWLLKNAYNEDLLSEDFFKLFLEYIAKLFGKSRDTTFKIAQDVVNRLGSEEQKDDETTDQKDDEKRKEQIKLNRAKEVVRVLS